MNRLLSNGLILNSDGTITGTPTTAGTINFTATATNSYGSVSKALSIIVGAGAVSADVPSDPVTFAVSATGSGTQYNVNSDTDMDNVPWGALGAGDVVNIFHKATPYTRKWGMGRNLDRVGTEANPIVINGVTDSNGNRPQFNWNGGRTATGSNPSLLPAWVAANPGVSPSTKYDSFNQSGFNIEDYAGILIWGGFASKPSFFQIKNLDLFGARGSFTNLSGNTQAWVLSDGKSASSGIRFQTGRDCLVQNCVIRDCAWGVFTQISGSTLTSVFERLTMRYNRIYGCGTVGSDTEHNAYIQCVNPVIEGNYFGPLVPGASGSSYKSRSSGEIFRYNWVEANARAVDLVEPEDQSSGSVGIIDQADYGIDHVYGNVIAVDDDQMNPTNGVYHPFHFGSDKDYYAGFNPIYSATGETLASKNANWVGATGIVVYNNPSRNAGLWEAATSSTLTRAYYVNPTTSPAVLDKQPDNQQSSFVLWTPGVYDGSTVRKVFVQYLNSPARDGYEAELTATQVILRRNGVTVGTPYTHGLTNLTTTQYVLIGVELNPGSGNSVDVTVRVSDSTRQTGYSAPVRITYNDTNPLTDGHSGVLLNDGGTKANVRISTMQPSMGVHKYAFDSAGLWDIVDGGYRQTLAPFNNLTTLPSRYVGTTINGKPINRRQLYFYNNTFICNTVQNQVFFELNESTSRVDLWNNLFWVSKRGASSYNSGKFKINERGGVYNFKDNSNILFATAGTDIIAAFPADGTSGSYTHPGTYTISGRTLPGNLNNPITLDNDPLLTAVYTPTYNYLPTAPYATTGGLTSFPAGLPASFKNLQVQYQPRTRSNGLIARSSLNAVGAVGVKEVRALQPYEPEWVTSVTGSESTFDPPLETTGTILYVAMTGNDTTGNGTIGSPYATISKALSMITFGSGGTIYIRGGTYKTGDRLPVPAGNTNRWTRIRRYPGESVTLDGESTSGAPFSAQTTVPGGPYGNNGGYIEIHGLKGINYKNWGIFVSYGGGSNYLIRNCTSVNSPAMAKFGANWDVVNNTISLRDITINNCKWDYDTAAFTGSISGTTLTVTSISEGCIVNNMIIVGAGITPSTRIGAPISATGGVGTYSVNQSQTVASTAIKGSANGTVFDFGPAPCNNISVDSVSIVRNNAVSTGDTAADGIALEQGGPISINRAYIFDVDGDCVDVKSSNGNASLTNSVGIQKISGRNVFKAWPGTGATAKMENCFAYRFPTDPSINMPFEMIALANTPGSQVLRRCTIINANIGGQNLIGYMDGTQATTVTIQGCTFSSINPSNSAVLIDIQGPLTDWKHNRFSSYRTDAIIRFPNTNHSPKTAYSVTQFNNGTFDTDFAARGMTDNRSEAPVFKDIATGNARLGVTDTIAANKYLLNNGAATDLDGNSGKYGTVQDIGAFERQADGVNPPSISTTALPNGMVGKIYDTDGFQLSATGTGSISWSVVSGASVLTTAGLILSGGGLLSGTCAAAVTGSVTFRATDSVGYSDKTLTLTIDPAPSYDTVVNLTTGYNTRAPFAVPVSENVTIGAVTTTKAVKLTGTGPVSSVGGNLNLFDVPGLTTIYGGGTLKISVDGGPFLTTEQPVYENSIIRCQYTLNSVDLVAIQLIFNRSTTPVYTGQVVFWAADTSRAPTTKQVGAGKTYATIADAINSGLVAGDTVEIYSGTYTGSMATNFGPVSAAAYVSKSGTPSLPITFRGMGATRPIIQATGPDNRCFWINASYINIQNIEFTNQSGQTNYQDYVQVQGNTGNMLVFDQCFFHGDVTNYGGVGYLSNDTRVGTQIFTRCEITGFGGSSYYGPAEHGIYASGAWQHYPDLYLEVNSCYFDRIISNTIKSRVRNNRIYFNTFVNRPGGMAYIGNAVYSYVATAYSLECIRNYEYAWVPGEYSTADIFGNLFVRNTQSNNVVPGQNPYPGNSAAIRTDNDGQGAGFYRVRLVNNSFWFDNSYITDNQPVLTSTQNTNTQYHQNNAVINANGGSGAINVFGQYVPYPGDPGAGWQNGKKLSLVNNWYPPGSYDNTSYPTAVTTPVTFGGPPNNISGSGGVQSAAFASLDMTPSAGSGLINTGTSIATMPSDYTIPYFNTSLNRKPLPISFTSGTTIDYSAQSGLLPIGAIIPSSAFFVTRTSVIDNSNAGTDKTITSSAFNMQAGDMIVFFVSHVTPNAASATDITATLSNGGTLNGLSTIGGGATVGRYTMGRIFTYTAATNLTNLTISANSNQSDVTYTYGGMAIRGAVYRPTTGKTLSVVGSGSKAEIDFLATSVDRVVTSPGTITNIGVVVSFYATERALTSYTQSATLPSGFSEFGTESYVTAADRVVNTGFSSNLTWVHDSTVPWNGDYIRSIIGAVSIQQSP